MMPASAGLSVAKSIRVLCIGEDRQLLDSRRLVLESRGYEVLAVASLTHVGREALRSFKLAILCHTLNERRSVTINSIRQIRPEMPILLLNTLYGNDAVDGLEAVGPAPATLLQAVERIAMQVSVNGTHAGYPFQG